MATHILQCSHLRLSSRTIIGFHSIQHHATSPPLQLFQTNHFASQRPKSFISLSNPNRRRPQKTTGDTTISTDWHSYDIQLFQYFHDPRSSQLRILLDYFNVPYDCIEVTPFKKIELSHFQIPEDHHHAPLIRMAHRKKLKETIDTYKKEAVTHIPNGFRSDTLKIANVATFRDRIRECINKYEGKSDEEKDALKLNVDELFEHYDAICQEQYNFYFQHNDLFDKLLPFLESNLSNDQHRRYFNDKCDKEKVKFYSTKYPWVLQACIAKSFHSCFQLFSYVKMFRKTRKWSKLMVERTHLLGGLKMRVLQKRKYCKKAETGNQPKGQAMKLTYEFLQTFILDMPDLTDKGKIPKSKGDEEDNTKADIGLIGKPFHGGRSPDILDLLVYGALRGTQGLDIYNYLFRKATQIDDWYRKMEDEVGLSSCKKHV
eukprot:90446_1